MMSNRSPNGSVSTPAEPDTEVVVRAERRRFSAEYKLRVLQEADQCAPGDLGALLRREGLYSSHLSTWRRQREAGQLASLAAQKRGRKTDPQVTELARLQRENARLQAQLQRAELIIDAQKKLLVLLNQPTPAESERT
jgi:transposase-like protein